MVEAPPPQVRRGSILIDTKVSLISTGTERMLVDFGRAGLINKARSQPEEVRQVLDKVATDGLLRTIDAVRSKLSQPIPLSYRNVGDVCEALLTASVLAIGWFQMGRMLTWSACQKTYVRKFPTM